MITNSSHILPMNKNFTPTHTFTSDKDRQKASPSAITLAKIRQFARAYSFNNTKIASLGGIVLN